MDVDPMEYVEAEETEEAEGAREKDSKERAERARLNSWVAITVATLATFLTVCNVKDGNIVQAMQQAQAQSIDTWAWYQAKKTRLEVYRSTALQLHLQALALPPAQRAPLEKGSAGYVKKADDEQAELDQKQKDAKAQDDLYNAKNLHDDQFDLCEACISLAIALLAVTSLTQKRWLFGLAMVPAGFGILMGLAGLFGLRIHPDFLTNLLS